MLNDLQRNFPRTAAVIAEKTAEGGGGQLYVSRWGQPLLDYAWGKSWRGRDLTPDILVPWASAVKPSTCVTVLRRWEQGLLDLDDPVVKFIPEFAANGKEKVTIRHLLTHTAHLGGYPGPAYVGTWEDTVGRIAAAPRLAQMPLLLRKLEAGETLPPALPPPPLGTTPGYNPAGLWILAEIVRRLDGRPFSEIVRQEVYEPCGMEDSWNGIPRERFRAYGDRLQTPSVVDEDAAAKCQPAGGGVGPSRELGRFYEMLLNRGQSDGRRILTPQTVEAMTARHTTEGVRWGLGTMLNFPLPGQAAEMWAKYGGEPAAALNERFDLAEFANRVRFGLHASPRTFGHGGAYGNLGFADPEHGVVVSLICGYFGAQIATAVYEDLGLIS